MPTTPRRLIAAGLAGLLATGLLAACGNDNDDCPPPGTDNHLAAPARPGGGFSRPRPARPAPARPKTRTAKHSNNNHHQHHPHIHIDLNNCG